MNPMDPISEERLVDRVHIVDCTAAPFTKDHAWLAETHQKMGNVTLERRQENGEDNLYVDGEKVVLHRLANQRMVPGSEIRKELEGMKVLNANILDYLIKHQELIPESWKNDDEGIFFWGTVYFDFSDKPFVRYLYWRDGEWVWLCKWLNGACAGPVAMLAS